MDRMTSKHRFLALALGTAMVAASVNVAPAEAAGRRDVRAERNTNGDDDRWDRGRRPSRGAEQRRDHRKAAPSRRPARPVIVKRPAPRPTLVHWRPAPRPVVVHRPAPRPVIVHRPLPRPDYRERRHYPRRHFVYRDRHGNEVAAAIIGFGLGFVAKAILDDQHRAVPETVTYVPLQDGVADGGGAPASCLQTREYQTTIEIDGITREAYGTACLQPDGAWLMGAPEPVEEFEDYNG